MVDILMGLSKSSIRSVFTAEKYHHEILDADLHCILFIRNLIEENLEFVKANFKDIDTRMYFSALKEYALNLFIDLCLETSSIKDKNEDDFNIEEHKEENREYFNYIYSNLKYPKPY